MRIGIIGGGIAGMSFAAFLEKQGQNYTVIEQAPEWERVGWGIGLQSNGVEVLNQLDITEHVYEAGEPLNDITIRKPGGEQVTRYQIDTNDRIPFLTIHRADLHDALKQKVPQSKVKLNSSPNEITEEEDGVIVKLEDGEVEEFDLLIGADGVHSTVRKQCFEKDHESNTNIHVWSFWTPEDFQLEDKVTSIWSSETELFAAQIGDNSVINIATRQKQKNSAKELFEETANQIGWKIPEVVEAINYEDIFHDKITTVEPFDSNSDRVILIGDSAHAVNPISGMGASLALQDSLALSMAVKSEDNVESIIRSYEAERRAKVEKVQRRSKYMERLAFTKLPGLPSLFRKIMKYTQPIVELYLTRKFESQRESTKIK